MNVRRAEGRWSHDDRASYAAQPAPRGKFSPPSTSISTTSRARMRPPTSYTSRYAITLRASRAERMACHQRHRPSRGTPANRSVEPMQRSVAHDTPRNAGAFLRLTRQQLTRILAAVPATGCTQRTNIALHPRDVASWQRRPRRAPLAQTSKRSLILQTFPAPLRPRRSSSAISVSIPHRIRDSAAMRNAAELIRCSRWFLLPSASDTL